MAIIILYSGKSAKSNILADFPLKCKYMDTSIGAKIRLYRKSKKISQAKLGKQLGYSARTISDWENNITEPSISAIKALVKFFDITFDEFFNDYY